MASLCNTGNINTHYNTLLEKYTLLCVKVANLLDLKESEDEILKTKQTETFMDGIYPFLDKLTSVEKLQMRIIFQKMLYKYCFNPNMTININKCKENDENKNENDKLLKITQRNDPIRVFRMDEELFYNSYTDFLTNIDPKYKLQFQIELVNVLSKYMSDLQEKRKSMKTSQKKDAKKINEPSNYKTIEMSGDGTTTSIGSKNALVYNASLHKNSNKSVQKSNDKLLKNKYVNNVVATNNAQTGSKNKINAKPNNTNSIKNRKKTSDKKSKENGKKPNKKSSNKMPNKGDGDGKSQKSKKSKAKKL